MVIIFTAIIPVALIILVGFVAGKFLPLETQTLSQLSIYILAPALIIDSLYRTTLSAQSTLSLLVGFALISLILYGITWSLNKFLKLSPATHKSLLVTTLLPNNGYLGLPLIAFALGEAGLERAIVYMIGSSILMFGITPALLSEKGLDFGIKLTLKLPLMWSILAGFTLHLSALELPLQIDRGIQQLGQAAIPMALILLGMQLSTTRFTVRKYEVFASSLRLLLAPLVAYIIGNVLGLQGMDLQVLILQSAMPAAFNNIVIVTEFGGDAPKVARTIVLSTLSSLLTLPLVLWVAN
jgi:predicted permease